jgi:hypothetical protein
MRQIFMAKILVQIQIQAKKSYIVNMNITIKKQLLIDFSSVPTVYKMRSFLIFLSFITKNRILIQILC